MSRILFAIFPNLVRAAELISYVPGMDPLTYQLEQANNISKRCLGTPISDKN
jgi:hypothetical protein